jgi:hypothetical protein
MEELKKSLEDDESDITDMKTLIYSYVATTIMTPTMNEPSNRSKNIRNLKFWKIRMHSYISKWRK